MQQERGKVVDRGHQQQQDQQRKVSSSRKDVLPSSKAAFAREAEAAPSEMVIGLELKASSLADRTGPHQFFHFETRLPLKGLGRRGLLQWGLGRLVRTPGGPLDALTQESGALKRIVVRSFGACCFARRYQNIRRTAVCS